MAKQLIKFNGRAYCLVNRDDPFWQGLPDKRKNGEGVHGYIAAYSRADACRLIEEYKGRAVPHVDTELKVYWHKGSWGNSMDGVEVERGIWIEDDKYGSGSKPVKVF